GAYLRLLESLLRHPFKVLIVALGLLVGAYGAYGTLGRGVEFFPEVEPETAQVQIRARGDLSIWERDALVRKVESRILAFNREGHRELESVYARTISRPGNQLAEDVIGVIQLELVEWDQRRPAARIMEELRQRTGDIPGLVLEIRKQQSGPTQGKPIEIEISSRDPDRLASTVAALRRLMDELGGLMDVEDSRPLPGIEWRLEVDREKAARFGADITLLGNAVQMVTHGIKVAGYRPDDTDEEVDIRVRFPFSGRNLDQLDQLRVPTVAGLVPITNFVTFIPAPKTGTLSRSDGRRVMTVSADVAEGLLVDDKVREIRTALAENPLPEVQITFKGQDEDQREAMIFLAKAFVTAIFLMAIILVTQFNSLYQAFLVLSAIVFSTAGVLLGLLITAQPFGIVMGGIGVIALAGIVVNNNIVLIDTFNDLRRNGMQPLEALLRTGAQRLRPVVLTSITTILGLMPMVLAINIDLIHREIAIGAPSTQWWTQLSSAIAGGLAFATLLTLILTPCLLMLGEKVGARLARRRPPLVPQPREGV
ncbi:MAG: efflux RND transporter permease subunit, partial [Candidatus Competibacteraceae bacterium]|nr:efflux RND transporter permease subunit [Candidatus Competibacteraceae bacterium]